MAPSYRYRFLPSNNPSVPHPRDVFSFRGILLSMTPLFGGKKDTGRTVLILDVESGSVGSALVQLMQDKQPKILGQTRSHAPLSMSRSGRQLFSNIQNAARDAVRNAAEVAARLRLHPKAAPLGQVGLAAVFLSPPWGKPNLESGAPDFMQDMSRYLRSEIGAAFDDIPVSLYTSAGAATFGARALFAPEPCLVCSITGEVSELMRMDSEGVRAHATIPTGFNSLVRTLRTHGRFSEAEARSAARLPFGTRHIKEPFAAAAAHFAGEFKDAAQELLSPGDVFRVRVIGHEPTGEWFARALSMDEPLAELFPQGGEVRAVRSHHLTPYIDTHAEIPDLILMLDALFVDSHFHK